MSSALADAARHALALMREQGFDGAQASASLTLLTELNLTRNEPSLLRSAQTRRLALTGLVGGRKAATELTDLGDEAVRLAVARLHRDALAALDDAANAVSADQQVELVQGPQEADVGVLATKVRELLDFRRAQTPRVVLKEGLAAHTLTETFTVTSLGSRLHTRVGAYTLTAIGAARDGARTSSFNHAGGQADDLTQRPAHEHFGIGDFMLAAERQLEPKPFDDKFVGDVVLTPSAVASLLGWLQGQLGDERLIAGNSVYQSRVGETIASPLLSVHSRFDAPGVAAVSTDAFAAPPVELLRRGVLRALTPSLYASRRTGLPHVPTAAAGWAIAAGDTPLDTLIAEVPRGALVDRLSMGMPAPNGDFSGVIKNSFAIDKGRVGHALAETMVAGNMARMLLDVVAVSRERIDTGALLLPWLRIRGMNFS